MAREGAGECEFLIYLYSNKLAYLQLITVLVYGNPKVPKVPKVMNKVT